VSTTEELLGRKNSGSGVENREYCRRDPSCCPRGTLYPQELALTSPTSCGRSVGIVRSRTQAMDSFCILASCNVLEVASTVLLAACLLLTRRTHLPEDGGSTVLRNEVKFY
jgi:hypothetical protein